MKNNFHSKSNYKQNNYKPRSKSELNHELKINSNRNDNLSNYCSLHK